MIQCHFYRNKYKNMKVKYHEVKKPIVLKSKSAQTRTHIYVYHVMKNNNTN